ncbi:Predicted thiol-disulfide oxidoreductase YuxK, DCC family [Streptomyces zhaozhouensis]|uniref:Predicted thiol-disulfide oxidoreductase YuxK, DCC family n=1 Tax=Streptomyces zhaozhouensis TaxID=1300267 RepID=A0A286DRX3_9ACTN|nr:DUF393 domain-containing protein [Streptomyces zhaozhouensis]SOD61408.1 Predicted thiol-disulfide oxidoreductase YuxK, DCC family [Streptomyces zhaozhouensis]
MNARPVLVFDGDCGFCTTSVNFAERRIRPDCTTVAWQFADLDALGVTEERARHEVLWVTPNGRVYGGAAGVAKLLMRAGGVWAPLGAALMIPPVSWLAAGVYRLVARNRQRLPGGTAACALPPPPGARR